METIMKAKVNFEMNGEEMSVKVYGMTNDILAMLASGTADTFTKIKTGGVPRQIVVDAFLESLNKCIEETLEDGEED